MTSAEIRSSFLNFFKSKQHSIVPSASLMPQSPGLLFTNAGMNQFVPYFLGTEVAPYSPARATDTQKCIRAGGKHNDLEDVGYDTYHHTFFEMLGNWSFGDYFKKEAIEWGWELIVDVWGVPAKRLYATVYAPSEGDPSEFDQEAYDLWAGLFTKAGLDPKKHIINGNVKNNFWMMGETGPCGPCSELHVDLTPDGDSDGKLVNMDSDLCIEIWNLVFIQYNAESDGSFRDLPSKHVDTGMGFERACSLIQNTSGFSDFSKKPSNYATDVFQPIFRTLEKLSNRTYQDIYPTSVDSDKSRISVDIKQAVSFRVIADHVRTLAFSIADGILPGNNGRNYVLRRILRRAVRYGRTLGFSSEQVFLPEIVDTLVEEYSCVFPELKNRSQAIKETLRREESSFNETLDRGLAIFEQEIADGKNQLCAEFAFKLYDTYGFPIDLTELLCSERGLTVDRSTFEKYMQEQRERARAAHSQQLVRATDISTEAITEFIGFNEDDTTAIVLEIHKQDEALLVITNRTPFYAEMGGQIGDRGTLRINGITYPVSAVQQIGSARAHSLPVDAKITNGDNVTLEIDSNRRRQIEAHHSATHLLHWALHEVISTDATQQGSMVSSTHMRFDFNSGALNQDQIDLLESKVNTCIEADEPVTWLELPHAQIKGRKDIQQFFGDKYGKQVRVVQIGGKKGELNGYSMELCGGTHVSKTSDIGTFKIKSEGAIASGIRRIEAVCGKAANDWIYACVEKAKKESEELREKLDSINEKLKASETEIVAFPEFFHDNSGKLEEGSFEQRNTVLKDILGHTKELKAAVVQADKALKKAQFAGAAELATALIDKIDMSENIVISQNGSPALLQELLNSLKGRQFNGAAFCIINDGSKLHLGAFVGSGSDENAGKLIQELAPIAGGKGGGKIQMARGAAPKTGSVDKLIAQAKKALG
ncbi:MAG: alanine--tRNA ligase, partial [Verrucomicrobiota bacterium]|nr:alanine--tRNA ligase [Verrucomicrobiota bacterium]